jgi:hypothetical protein
VAQSHLEETTAPLLQGAAHNLNNTIAIGALIYVNAQCRGARPYEGAR